MWGQIRPTHELLGLKIFKEVSNLLTKEYKHQINGMVLALLVTGRSVGTYNWK
jgi:hypothetical protein